MPLQIVVAVRDSAMNAFAKPFVVPTPGLAIRSFTQEVNRQAQDNPMNTNPDDFELWTLASYDEDTGEFTNNSPRLLVRAKDVLTKE